MDGSGFPGHSSSPDTEVLLSSARGKEDGNRGKQLWRGMKEPEMREMLVRLERKEDFGGRDKLGGCDTAAPSQL